MAKSIPTTTTAGIKYGLYPVAKIEENPWNMNVMPADKYGAVRDDMKRGGLSAIDPILIVRKRIVFKDSSIPENLYIAISGNHRLRLAKELGWPKIRAGQDPAIDSEERARVISYIKNAEHGEIDPYRLADYFQWFVDKKKLTHEKIAKNHNIDRTTVTRILSLLKIAPEVKKKLANVPYITISHLEPIATAPHHIQREVAKHINKRDHSTVADVTRCTRHITEEFEKRERLKKAVERAKFPKCPKCGKSPKDFSYRGGDYVQCDNFDNWSLSKGLEQERPVSTGSGEPKIPQSIKTERTMAEFRAAFRRVAAKVLSNIDVDGIDSISIDGRGKDGKKVSFTARFYDWNASVELGSARYTMRKDIDLSVSKCKIKDRPKIRTRIKTGEYIDSKQKLAKLERQVSNLFKKFSSGGR